MNYQDIQVSMDSGVATIVLNRPTRLNAMLRHTVDELHSALDAIEAGGEARAVILTGAPRPDGRPCFSSGLDVKEIAEVGVPPLKRPGLIGAIEGIAVLEPIENTFMRLCDRLEDYPLPTIAAVDGVCAAGGLEVALCCNFRLVAETAQISDLHVKNLAIIGGGGATVRLARLLGPGKALEITLISEAFDGKEAARLGLANQAFPSASLLAEARKWGAKLASLNPDAVRLARASINTAMDMSLREALRYSYICWAALGNAKATAQQFSSKKG